MITREQGEYCIEAIPFCVGLMLLGGLLGIQVARREHLARGSDGHAILHPNLITRIRCARTVMSSVPDLLMAALVLLLNVEMKIPRELANAGGCAFDSNVETSVRDRAFEASDAPILAIAALSILTIIASNINYDINCIQ